MINRTLLDSLKNQLSQLYGDTLVKLVLFGSHANNLSNADSDVDILVVLNKTSVESFKEIDFLTDKTYSWAMENNLLLSFVPMSFEQYKIGRTPLLHFIRNEGVDL